MKRVMLSIFMAAMLSISLSMPLFSRQEKNDDLPKGVDPKDVEEIKPAPSPEDIFKNPVFVDAFKAIFQGSAKQPKLSAAKLTIQHRNHITGEPPREVKGELYIDRSSANGPKVLWKEKGEVAVVIKDSSCYVNPSGKKSAFKYSLQKKDKCFIQIPLLNGITEQFFKDFDIDIFAVPLGMGDVRDAPPDQDAPPPPSKEEDPAKEGGDANGAPPQSPYGNNLRKQLPAPDKFNEVRKPGFNEPQINAKPPTGSASDASASEVEYCLRLIPKIGKADAPYASSLYELTIWIHKETFQITRLKLVEVNGAQTEVVISDWTTQSEFPTDQFTKPLTDLKIIEAK